MSDTTPAGPRPDVEPVTLLVLARERPAIARRLLDHAPDPALVRSTSEGYVVPRWLAELAGLVLPDPVEHAGVATVEGGAQAYPISAANVEAGPVAELGPDAATVVPAGRKRKGGSK